MRILGIDLGSSSIKAVEMDSAFGRFDIHDYHEYPITPEISAQQAVEQLLSKLPKPPDRIIVAVQTDHSTFRNLQLPTRDKKAIQSGVGFELEDELPFPVEESIFDYAILSQSKQGSSIHVAASLKRHLVTALEKWKSTQIDPDIITTEAWAYRTFLNRVLSPSTQNAPVLLVQIGHERTTLYLHWQGTPALTRELRWGGSDLTQAISQKYSISIEQAETAKLDHGYVSHQARKDVTHEQSEFSACLEAQLETLILELRQIGLMSKNVTHHNIGLIQVSGGTSLLPGLIPWIEHKLKIPTQSLLALSSATASGVTYSDQTDARFLLAVSLALSLVGPDRASCISFRKGEFAKGAKSREIKFGALKKPLMAVGIVSFCLILSLIVQSSVYKSRLTSTDALLEKSVRSFFGQISSSSLRAYMNSTSMLRSSVNRELTKQRELTRLFGPNAHSPIDFLNTLSTSISKDMVVDLVQFQAGSTASESYSNGDQTPSTSLTFLVSNPQVAERLATVLNGKITNIQRGKMEEVASTDGSPAKWKLTFSGTPTEDSYGK